MVTLRFCINFAKLASIGGLAPRVRSTRFIEYLEIWIFHACVVVCRGPRARPANTFLEHYNFVNWCVNATLPAQEYFWCSTRHAPKGIRGLRRWCRQNPTDFKSLFWTFLRTLLDSLTDWKKLQTPHLEQEAKIVFCIASSSNDAKV